ncbi:protein phosphatase 1L [Schistocerca serialis cubense]|uniref:protein phosphatase 1L n=1 Tax=Schistocerca serialis cubense TaxID=2023355 RepID=UPI00214E4C3F|nr:protein phosphatase 1L [Schistocerca serialis cubense]
MEDELEDRVLYQTYISHMKLISRFAVGVPLNTNSISCMWRFLRIYVLKPEVLLFSAILFLILIYVQALDVWSRSLLGRLQYTALGRSAAQVQKLQYLVSGPVTGGEKLSWELREGNIAAYAVQGRRPRMEDRFVVNEDINKTGVSLYAVFDGHGGEFAANYARDKLIQNLYNKVIELKRLKAEGKYRECENVTTQAEKPQESNKTGGSPAVDRKKSFRKAASQTDDCVKKRAGGIPGVTDPELLQRLGSLSTRTITREARPSTVPPPPTNPPIRYLDASGTIDYGRLLTDEVLAADHLLVEAAKKSLDVAGTTALIALLEGNQLVVANVGDSRGVMCDSRGNAIPLSFDHKPQQVREKKRIKEAGGFVTFNGVWRVAGILATSRALGDYPLKDKKLVIADPDILTFDLSDHKPQFLILASDGLWDTFTNEEAVAFIKERLNEPHYGAKSITLQSYYRGSLDNITVVVINFKEQKWSYASAKKTD